MAATKVDHGFSSVNESIAASGGGGGEFPDTIAVTGTFWQATQPVSIASMPTTAVTIASMPSTPVTIASMPSTPVTIASMPSTPVTIASMPSTPVTGTFWQATQDVNVSKIAGQTCLAGGGLEANALRVTIANDSTGLISVDDNSGSLTVDGEVAITKTPLTAGAPTAASVGIASGSVVAANANRKGLILVNTSNNYISLGIGSSAVLYSGITLNPMGGTFCMDQHSMSTAAIYAIASAATSNLGITEFST